MDPVGGTLSERRAADEELESFVQSTLDSLISLEEDALQAPSSLRIVARLDVGVMRGTNGQLGYFVNEVERGIAISLFSRGNPRWAFRFADEFRILLGQWIKEDRRGGLHHTERAHPGDKHS